MLDRASFSTPQLIKSLQPIRFPKKALYVACLSFPERKAELLLWRSSSSIPNPALTKSFSEQVPQAVAWDTEARSLAAYATKAGDISLYVHLSVGATQRKRTIGRLGELDLTHGAEDGSRAICRRA